MTIYVELNDQNMVTSFHLEDAEGRVPIDDDLHWELLDKQDEGFDIFYDNGEFTFQKRTEESEDPPIEVRIMTLKYLLSDSDYKATKYAEGWYTEEEYAPIKAQRQAWRDEINQLEEEIASLNNNMVI